MNITLDRDKLLEKLNLANKFASNRLSSMAALQGVLMEIAENEAHLYSTNLSYYYHGAMKVSGGSPAKIIIDARKIGEFLNLMPAGNLEVEIDEKTIAFTQGKIHGKFPLMKMEDFPLPPKIEEKRQKIPGEFMVKNLPPVLFAAARDESRPVLSGINFLRMDEQLYIVATDGFRLSLIKTNNKFDFPPMLVPAEFITEILRQLAGVKELEFGFSSEEKAAVFKTGDDEFYTRLIEGDFPPFEKVIPAEFATKVVLDTEEAARYVKLISVVARDFSNIVICEFKKSGVIYHPKTDAGGGNSAVQEAEFEGDEQKVAFNYKFLLDFLNNFGEKKVVVEILRSDAPIVFKKEKDPGFLHIIMPVRIQE